MRYFCLALSTFSLSSVVAFAQNWMPKRIVGIEYPPLATQARIEGTVKLEFLIEKDGSVTSTRTLTDEETAGHHLLGDAATQNALKWYFIPQQGNGSTGPPGGFVVTYIFKLHGAKRGKLAQEFVFDYPNEVVVTSEAACPDHLPCNEAEARELQKTQKKSPKPYVIP